MKKKLKFLSYLTFLTIIFVSINIISAQTEIELSASMDNTLYENPTGNLSNGSGSYFFVGRTNETNNYLRRGLIYFDLTSLPTNISIQSVVLQLNVSKTISGNQNIELKKVLTKWGEGTSDASGEEGIGATAAKSDATWSYAIYDSVMWNALGGDFENNVSAVSSVGGSGFYSWGSTDEMVADVQSWVDNPENNFGWILIGNEDVAKSAKRFDSRENPNGNIPKLKVTYQTIVGISEQIGETPSQFKLHQNYPNPFNPSTNIKISVAEERLVNLEVFNVLGIKIATLLNEKLSAGTYILNFNATDFSSGMYLYKFSAGEYIETRKMLYVK